MANGDDNDSGIIKNVCQYWSIYEPSVCAHWNTESLTCANSEASSYPSCNNLGTDATCSKYSGAGVTPICILPDGTRHVVNRETGLPWEIDDITGYNGGQCDTFGTITTCKGYSPYHLAFSELLPSDEPDIDVDIYANIDAFGYRLPLYYTVYNIRSVLGCCFWWKDSPSMFSISTDGAIDSITSKCECSDVASTKYKDPSSAADEHISTYGYVLPPCNGCQPECPNYTNICWDYCVESKMVLGNKVLGEQIQELRYYIKRENWNADLFAACFLDPDIYAWGGPEGTSSIMIPAVKIIISDFDDFTITATSISITAGTEAVDGAPTYPTLVKALEDVNSSILIRNSFEGDIFDTPIVSHKFITFFGDVFYNEPVYGINLSDPVFDSFSSEFNNLILYDNIFSIKEALGSIAFRRFYYRLDSILNGLKINTADKFVLSYGNSEEGVFFFDLETFFNDNIVCAFVQINGEWEYSKIAFNKRFCSGVIAQTVSNAVGNDDTIDYLPDYQIDFSGHMESNEGSYIQCAFKPIVHSPPPIYSSSVMFASSTPDVNTAYIYNDSFLQMLTTPMKHERGYKVWEISIDMEATIHSDDTGDGAQMRPFGRGKYLLVVIDDLTLSNVIKPWEIVDDDITLELEEEDVDGNVTTTVIDMEREIISVDKIPVNQMIVKFKNDTDIVALCDPNYKLKCEIIVYEKHSFNQPPLNGVEVEDDYVYKGDGVSVQQHLDTFTLTNCGDDSIALSVVYKNEFNRIIGEVKSKVIMWIRQPYCRDVEIRYQWKASYNKYHLMPQGWSRQEPVSVELVGSFESGNTPPCGDHSAFSLSKNAPMWYPYTACESYDRYTGVSCGRVKEVFAPDGDHGRHDMRMAGPDSNIALITDTHKSIFDCYSDYSYGYGVKVGANIFTGYGYYRGGIDAIEMTRVLRYDGDPPVFGNPIRDYLRTYRAVDNVWYVYIDYSGNINQLKKWMPAAQYFTVVDVTGLQPLEPYSDYTDGHHVVHPFGLMVVSDALEGVTIGEVLDYDNRYRFDTIFKTHVTTNVAYPKPSPLYYNGDTPLMSWLSYRPYPEGGGDSIQWAWQEIWKNIERNAILNSLTSLLSTDGISDDASLEDSSCFTSYEQSLMQYIDFDNYFFSFISIEHPEYKWDFNTMEFRTVCEEGDHYIFFKAPLKDEEEGYIGYPSVSLDDGPCRYFDWNGDWDPVCPDCADPDLREVYMTCTQDPWITDVTLFDATYTSKEEDAAESDGRMIKTYDDVGEVETYFQRGLDVEINTNLLTQAPVFYTKVDEFRLKYNIIGDFELEPESTEGIPGGYINGVRSNTFSENDDYISYDCTINNEIIIEYRWDKACVTVAMLKCMFTTGVQILEPVVGEDGELEPPKKIMYHIPGVTVLDLDGTLLYECDTIVSKTGQMSSRECVYEWSYTFQELRDGKEGVKIKFKLGPINDMYLQDYDYNVIKISFIEVYEVTLHDAMERIKTYERKYYVSHGKHGDFPPQGADPETSLLWTLPDEFSTVWQKDTLAGVFNQPNSGGSVKTMNKCRGRIMLECKPDKEMLSGDLASMESEQKVVHDNVVNQGNTTFSMHSVIPPSLSTFLVEINAVYPQWTCLFTNTLLAELTSVTPVSSYSAGGHYYIHDFSHYNEYDCWLFGGPQWWLFSYMLIHVEHTTEGEQPTHGGAYASSPILENSIYASSANVAQPFIFGI